MNELTETREMTDAELKAEDKEIRAGLKNSIELGKDLIKLRGNIAFQNVVENVFIKVGLDILWENIRHLEEEQMKGRGSDKNLEIIKMLKEKVASRLDFDGFMDTLENDYANAHEELEAMNREEEGQDA